MEEIGLDAVVFMRFLHMIRSIFHILTIFGCGILIRSMWLAATISMISGIWATLMKFMPQYVLD